LLTHAEVPQAAEGAEGDERRRGRNRRGRNRGRDRAERTENNAEATTEVTTSTETTANTVVAPTATVVAAVSETVPMNDVAPAAMESSAAAPSLVVDAAPAINTAPAVTSTPAEVATPVVAAPAPLPKVEFKPLQTSELTSVIESAGMVWVNTDHQKLEEVRAQIAAEPAIVYPPREPKPPVEISTGPMVLVETGGKEQTIQK
jgi:ribonuclease E